MNQDLYLHGLIGGGSSNPTAAWVRPTDWISVPDLTLEDDKIYILMAIEQTTANFVAFNILTTAISNYSYIVDWGDGTVATVENDSTYHTYDWDDISSDTYTSDGYRQVLITITPPEGDTITEIDLQTYLHPNAPTNYVTTVLELKLNCPNATTVRIGPGD